jgi:uncharacterized protein
MMKRIISVIALVLCACTGASAESSVWKAQKGTAIIYLGGTCHLLRDSDYPLPPEFDTAYRASGIVVFETDVDKVLDPATQQKLLAKSVYVDGSTIDRHLSPRTYGELSAYCAANNFPLKAFSTLKPAPLMVTLMLMEFTKMGVTGKGVDLFYYELARKDNKVVEGLETVDQQVDYVVSMADGDEDEFVTYSLKDMKTMKAQFERLARAWREGDAEQMNTLMNAELQKDQPVLYKKLISDRNAAWLPLIDTDRKTPGTRFILVGMGHLVGPDGLIEALKKRGYRVEKL